MIAFGNIATFLQNQFIKNCFVTSFLNRFSNFFHQIKEYFTAISIVCNIHFFVFVFIQKSRTLSPLV